MNDYVITSPKGKALLEYLPPFYDPIYDFRALVQAEGIEFDDLAIRSESLLDQTSVGFATWSLERWEKEFGVRTEAGKPIDQRRSVVISKLRGSGTVTVALIKNVAESYANGEVYVTEQFNDYVVKITFVSQLGIPPNIEDITKALREIIPAHLQIEYSFKYVTYGMLEDSGKTFGQIEVKGLTFGQLETTLP
ncbi:putative phage tail protein [Paenibacillus sp. KN14-4R]|uniref:putative phage tail protein n=1 Tax=Paenibacillus sp. KN14-4R TaxID=3445773 RepID=UPI003FA0B400